MNLTCSTSTGTNHGLPCTASVIVRPRAMMVEARTRRAEGNRREGCVSGRRPG